MIVTPDREHATLATMDSAWDILERFGLALQQCDRSREQIPLTLQAVRDSLNADAVLWFPGDMTPSEQRVGDFFEGVGSVDLSQSWTRRFLQHVLPSTLRCSSAGPGGTDRLVRQFLDPAERPITPWPCSAALTRISKSRGAWLIALSFHPRRLFHALDLKILLLARRMLLIHRQHYQTHERLRESLLDLVRCLTLAIDAKDPYTWGHSERVARIASHLGGHMGLPATTVHDIYLAGLLHDIGKIGVPDAILDKPGRLTEEELIEMRSHTVKGYEIMSQEELRRLLRVELPALLQHHERLDGNGYPHRIAGDQISWIARIVAVADVFDALTSVRPYKEPWSAEQAIAYLRERKGIEFDAACVEALARARAKGHRLVKTQGERIAVSLER